MCAPDQVRVIGPMVPYVAGFCEELAEQGYTPLSIANQVRLLAHVSRWLQGRRLGVQDLTLERIKQFPRARRKAGYTGHTSDYGLVPLLGYLRRLQVVPAVPTPTADTALDHLVDRYSCYLRHERGLAPSTIRRHRDIARHFLARCLDPEKLECNRLQAEDVTQFILYESRNRSVGTAKLLVSDLRSLLRYFYREGKTRTDLSGAVPAIAARRLTSLPQAIEPEEVTRLLESCDRQTSKGLRDFALLLLLVRLGLRAGETVALELDDIDWEQGEIEIRGKGRRQERLPLPVDVGEALVAYLRRGRPDTADRHLFLRSRAPRRALSSSAVGHVVYEACDRAQIPRVGPHRLRHTAATHMLCQGASLPEIAQVLRHRHLETTAIYAKVDRTALRELAQPWPGGLR